MSTCTSLLRWCAAVALLLSVAACAQRPGPDDWYRVDPLFTNDDRDTIARDGSLNPYRFRFEDQPKSLTATDRDTLKTLAATRSAAQRGITKSADNPLAVASQEALLLAVDAEVARKTFATAYAAALANVDNRNRYIALLIAQSDSIVGGHLASIIGTQNALELSMGTTALVTSALATAFTPVGTKTALSAASAIASGTRTSVRETVYSNAFGWAIAQSIIEDRTKFLKDTILVKAQSLDARTYTIDHAIADIQTYHERGSFYNGLIEINKRVAGGNRQGLFPGTTTLPRVTVPKSITVDKSKPEAKLSVEFETVDAKAFKIKFESVASVTLVNPKDPLIAAIGKTDSKEFEVRLSGTVAFNVVPVLTDSAKPDGGFQPIIIQAEDAKFTRYVTAVVTK